MCSIYGICGISSGIYGISGEESTEERFAVGDEDESMEIVS